MASGATIPQAAVPIVGLTGGPGRTVQSCPLPHSSNGIAVPPLSDDPSAQTPAGSATRLCNSSSGALLGSTARVQQPALVGALVGVVSDSGDGACCPTATP